MLARWTVVTLAIWALARLTGADRIPFLAGLLVPVLAFTPYAAAFTAVPMVYALAARRWRMLGVTAVIAGAFAVAVAPRAIGDSGPAADGPSLRVLTANLRLGRADPHALVGLVRRTGADVLSVQEFTDQAGTGLDRAGLARLLPYRVTMPMAGAQGSGLYARYPLRALPTFRVAEIGLAMPHAEMRLPGGHRVDLFGVHLARPMSPAGVGQWRRGLVLVPAAARRGVVRILAGDFNATLDHAPLRGLLGEGYADAADRTGAGLIPTFRKAWWTPPITLDHILVDARCAVRRVDVYGLPRSDHRAVLAQVRLP
ncbi:endonuclease/exonuclease/phosphatase family protein [Actinoallomurus soli]|uniref:endonuclease/exonuclease/phosphatase family protein n=1 Tax=Actinoallomurus soli TaxID=2952535 RepID=UPI002093855B|nr:endonuclease/exonuclease/phosphatase family protein [Actinoallomurus soli]MCO5969989.1 endonuclease/exonuclease/phosphatase family protein [Actinoallomurus soli]